MPLHGPRTSLCLFHRLELPVVNELRLQQLTYTPPRVFPFGLPDGCLALRGKGFGWGSTCIMVAIRSYCVGLRCMMGISWYANRRAKGVLWMGR